MAEFFQSAVHNSKGPCPKDHLQSNADADDAPWSSASVRYPGSRHNSTKHAGCRRHFLAFQGRIYFCLNSVTGSRQNLMGLPIWNSILERRHGERTGTGNSSSCIKASLIIRAVPAHMQNYLLPYFRILASRQSQNLERRGFLFPIFTLQDTLWLQT